MRIILLLIVSFSLFGEDLEQTLKDAEILVQALENDPGNISYAYYAGLRYLIGKRPDLAKPYFEKTLKNECPDHFRYFATYHLALCHEQLGEFDAAIETSLKASALRPTRAEPVFHAAIAYRQKGHVLLGYLLSKYALTLPWPLEENYIDRDVYAYASMIEFANCALLLGKFQEGLEACNSLLKNPTLPAAYKSQVVSNQQLAMRMITEKSQGHSRDPILHPQ